MIILDFRNKLPASSYVSNITMHVYVIKKDTSICIYDEEEVSFIYLFIYMCYIHSIYAIYVYT